MKAILIICGLIILMLGAWVMHPGFFLLLLGGLIIQAGREL